jgi:arginase
MQVHLFQVPYDSGLRGVRMGLGPDYFVRHGAESILSSHGWEIEVETIESQRPFPSEITTSLILCWQLAQRVQAVKDQGAFPLILAGNCNTSLGGIAGVGPDDLGVIWFDAHSDFRTPETSAGGMLDSMGLAMLTGQCWRRATSYIPGFSSMPVDRVLLVGARQLEPDDEEQLHLAQVPVVRGEQIRAEGLAESLTPAVQALRTRVQRLYVHLDLDVLDPAVGKANGFAEPGGLFVHELEQALALISQRFVIAGAALTAFDPTEDPGEGIFHAGTHLMESLLQHFEQRQRPY